MMHTIEINHPYFDRVAVHGTSDELLRSRITRLEVDEGVVSVDPPPLSNAQCAVLVLDALGFSITALEELTGRKAATLKSHRDSISDKLGAIDLIKGPLMVFRCFMSGQLPYSAANVNYFNSCFPPFAYNKAAS